MLAQCADMFLCVSLLILSALSLSGAMESGIVGGHEVEPHSRPYMASFQYNRYHMCGGMLIRRDYVLTTAHCVDNITCTVGNQLEVVLGAHSFKNNEFGQQRIPVQKCIKHPSYQAGKQHHDIMLLKLKTKAKLNKFVRLIDVPEDKMIPANQKCSIAGWGMKVPNGTGSNVLQEVSLKVQFNFECKKLWQQHFNSTHMICTASDGKRAFCQGDSGSPLICNKKPVGLAAFTYLYDCKSSKYPEVYTKTSYFVPWIKKIIH